MANRLKSYDKATQKLIQQAMKYDVESDTQYSLPEMVHLLRETYKYKLTYKKVFDEIRRDNADPATGFCIVSSYYIYAHTGGDAVWEIMQTPLHWWLRHRQTGDTFDVTYTQFDTPFPYHMGKHADKLRNDTEFADIVRQKAAILGKCAGME